MAARQLSIIARVLGASFAPYVPTLWPKILPLVNLKSASYDELRGRAIETVEFVRRALAHEISRLWIHHFYIFAAADCVRVVVVVCVWVALM